MLRVGIPIRSFCGFFASCPEATLMKSIHAVKVNIPILLTHSGFFFVFFLISSDRRWNKKQSVCSDLSMAGFFERPERIRSVFYLRLASVVPAIERIGIFSQNLFFGALRNVLAATDRRHDMRKHRIPMRIIGGKNDSV